MGFPLKRGSQNSYLLSWTHDIFTIGKHEKIKFGGTIIGRCPPTGLPKIKLFNHSRQTDEIFRINKYNFTIKYDKIWEYQNKSVPLKRGHQNQTF